MDKMTDSRAADLLAEVSSMLPTIHLHAERLAAIRHAIARLREPAGVGLTDAAIIAGWEAKADAIEKPEHIGDIDYGKAWQLRDCANELRSRDHLRQNQGDAE